MQQRHNKPQTYFEELATSSRNFLMPYLQLFCEIQPGTNVLEIGCGQGGILLPFAQAGCKVTGIDLSPQKIQQAKDCFSQAQANGTFLCGNATEMEGVGNNSFQVILVQDVIEHIEDKEAFVASIKKYAAPEAFWFFRFPAWQMPFGGHQQICRHFLPSHIPYFHLLPKGLYRLLLRILGEDSPTISELLQIKDCGTSIERFEALIKTQNFEVIDHQFYLINPHYNTKFGWKPRHLPAWIEEIPVIRNYFCSSCYYLLMNR